MNRFRSKALQFSLSLGVIVCLMTPATVFANPSSHTIVSRFVTTIQRAQTVEDVLVIGNNVTVAGDVSDVLVVLDGDIHLTATSRTGIVVDLGGNIQKDPGANVNAIYHVSLESSFWDGTLFGLVVALLGWAAMLVIGIVLVLASILIGYAFHASMEVPLQSLEQSVRRVGFTGLLVSVVFLALGALSAITVVGLPVAVVLLVVYALSGVMGFALVAVWAGNLALRPTKSEVAYRFWQRALLGASLMTMFSMVPFVGLLMFILLWLLAIGASTFWLFTLRSRPRN